VNRHVSQSVAVSCSVGQCDVTHIDIRHTTRAAIDFGLHGGGEACAVATISRMLQNVGL